MKNIIKLKNGMELNMTLLFTIIFLIVSFAIILMFWASLNPTGNIDKEACSTSVTARSLASSSLLKTDFREAVPLQCKTEKICFTSGLFSSGCDNFFGKKYDKISVGSNKDKILDALAEDIYSWHTTLGEGKLNFMPNGFLGNNYCFLNSLIYFDNKTQDQLRKDQVTITLFDLYTKLGEKTADSGKSYFEELFKSQLEIQTNYNVLADVSLDYSKEYMLVTRVSEVGTWKSWVGAAVGTTVASQVTSVILMTAFAPAGAIGLSIKGIIFVAKVGLAAGATTGYILRNDPDSKKVYVYSPPTLYPYDLASLKALDCDSWENLP